MGIYGEYFIFYLSSFGKKKKKEIKQYYLLPLLKHLFTFHGKNINFSKVKYTTSVFSYRQSNNKI